MCILCELDENVCIFSGNVCIFTREMHAFSIERPLPARVIFWFKIVFQLKKNMVGKVSGTYFSVLKSLLQCDQGSTVSKDKTI